MRVNLINNDAVYVEVVKNMKTEMYQLAVIYLTFATVQGRIGFKKADMMDFTFPPKLELTHGMNLPTGHLRPLGWQRKPDGQVRTEKAALSPRQFYDRYVKPRKPVVFVNALEDVPAMKTWQSDEHLKKQYGHLDINVVVKKEFLRKGQQRLKMSKFLYEYHYEDWYLSTIVPKEMMAELRLPKMLKCGLRNFLEESEVWMSSGGTSSLLHAHADHDLHCLLSGRKDIIMVDRQYRSHFDWQDGVYPGAGRSPIDMELLNMFKYKDIAKVPWTYYTLKPGDCIFIPAGYPHQVRSYGRSISSTMHIIPTPELNFGDCATVNLDKPEPLDKVNFLWTYVDGDKRLANRDLDAEGMRGHLLLLTRELSALNFTLFEAFYHEVTSEIDYEDDVTNVWNTLMPVNGTVSRESLKQLDREVLANVAKAFNKPFTKIVNHEEL